MGRNPRDREQDAAAISAAAERLLAGTPLRSASGRLTASELIIESGLRRDVVYPVHQGLVDEFRLRVKAQNVVPTAMQDLADERDRLQEELTEARTSLAAEQSMTAYLRRLVAELSVELECTRLEQEQSADSSVVHLLRPHDQTHQLRLRRGL